MHAENGQPTPTDVRTALQAVVRAERGLLGLTMPLCGACLLLPASFAEVARVRPGLTVAIGEFAGPGDWALREELLWPRGIHVSRASVPAMALLVGGEVIASRPGGGPAHVIDAWLEPHLGPAAESLGREPTPAEVEALEAAGSRIARQRYVKQTRL
jgi:hypothetical protein